MKKKIIGLLYFFVVTTTGMMHPRMFTNPMIFSIAMEFPTSVSKVPYVQAYRSGTKIKGDVDKSKISFSFHDDRDQTRFKLLIISTQDLHYVAQDNVIEYYYINPGAQYKFYSLA